MDRKIRGPSNDQSFLGGFSGAGAVHPKVVPAKMDEIFGASSTRSNPSTPRPRGGRLCEGLHGAVPDMSFSGIFLLIYRFIMIYMKLILAAWNNFRPSPDPLGSIFGPTWLQHAATLPQVGPFGATSAQVEVHMVSTSGTRPAQLRVVFDVWLDSQRFMMPFFGVQACC